MLQGMNARTRATLHAWGRAWFCTAAVLVTLLVAGCGDDESTDKPPTLPESSLTSWVMRWNEIAIDASGLDHTPPAAGENRVSGEQLGPGRASRAMAITHLAMFEAANAVEGDYQSFVGLSPRPARDDAGLLSVRVASGADHTEFKAALATAGHDALVAMFPAQAAALDRELAEDLARLAEGEAKASGIATGVAAAAAVLALRSSDGSAHPEPRVGVDYLPGTGPGEWRPDPISAHPMALGAHWGQVTPFTLGSVQDFRVPPPPELASSEYTVAFNEVMSMGGGGNTPTVRTPDDTFAGIYWAYDGMPSLCAPPRLYNQIAVTIAKSAGTDALELSRLLALINVSMADAAIAIWDSKYTYKFWRPVTAIREADAGTGPSGLGDGNAATIGDVAWTPLGAPASNAQGPNFTPPFPAYPSGHAGFGGAVFQILRHFFGTDDFVFDFVSDEWNGVTRDRSGQVRARVSRHFRSFSEAEEENGQSRIYLGIHWAFDKTAGIEQGRHVADRVWDALYHDRNRP